jgi:hypothetical protein
MRVDEAPRWPRPDTGIIDWVTAFLRALSDHWSRQATQLNALSAGNIAAAANGAAAPTTGTARAGDYVRNNAPSETGSGGSKYVVTGWLCITSGSPGTWVECRALTGN